MIANTIVETITQFGVMIAFGVMVIVILAVCASGTSIGRFMLPRAVTDVVSKLLPQSFITDAEATDYGEFQLDLSDDTAVVTPNADTPYSFLWMDLRTEPVVLSVPAINDDRYYSIQLTDLYKFNFDYIGSRLTGNGAGQYLIAGPDWTGETPTGIGKVIRCETEFALAIRLIQTVVNTVLIRGKRLQRAERIDRWSRFVYPILLALVLGYSFLF